MRAKKTYSPVWGIASLAVLVGVVSLVWTGWRPHAAPAAPRGGADWFLMLRMPELSTQYESGIATMKVRMDQWIEAMHRAGFVPVKFSDAVRRLAQGQGLPERALVLFFDPGYRNTHDHVGPIFEKHRDPVLWLTKNTALQEADRRYLTYHALQQMRAAGWDSGFTDAAAGDFSVHGLPEITPVRWSPEAGAFALNRWIPSRPLQYLTVNADWLPDELVNRLWVEAPASGTVVLGKALIHAREWGIAQPLDRVANDAVFDLQAPMRRRGTKLFWYGTRGQNDFRLKLRAQSLYGELWLQLRFDEERGEDVHLIFKDTHCYVRERRGGKTRRLANLTSNRPFTRRVFTADVIMAGSRMWVSIDGQAPQKISNVGVPESQNGLVQMYITDRLRGAAKARGLRILYSPIFPEKEPGLNRLQ